MNFIEEIKQSGLKQFWSKKPATEEEISSFEKDFAVSLPESYKKFLTTFGCGAMGHTEVYGLGCPDTGIPNVRFLVNALKRSGQLFPKGLIPVSDADEGFYVCILCEAVNGFDAGSIVVCRPEGTVESSAQTIRFLASNFDSFCAMEIESQRK